MAQHIEDKRENRVPFLTYIGGNSREELQAIISKFSYSKHQIRKAKRVPQFPFEMKVSGLSFHSMKTLVEQFKQSQAKAISLHQPWASLIALALKQFETRSWQTNYRGKLLICAAKKNTKEQQIQYETLARKHNIDLSKYPWDDLLFGHAVAVCNLTDCIPMTPDFIASQSELEHDCGHWEVGRFAWKLDDIKPFSNPIPFKGQQGLWDVQLDSIYTAS